MTVNKACVTYMIIIDINCLVQKNMKKKSKEVQRSINGNDPHTSNRILGTCTLFCLW